MIPPGYLSSRKESSYMTMAYQEEVTPLTSWAKSRILVRNQHAPPISRDSPKSGPNINVFNNNSLSNCN
jgi:hypothetical protein